MPSPGLRFAEVNFAESASVLNGTGPSPIPARDEVSPFVMDNALNNDSAILWQQSSGAGTTVLDIDLGADKAISFIAFLGHRGAPSGAVGIASVAPAFRTAAAGYTPGGPWTAFTGGSLTLGAGVRRKGVVLAAPQTGRYIHFPIVATTAFTLGRIFLGAVDVDLGLVASPGRRRTRMRPTMRSEQGGRPTITRVGDDFFVYELDYNRALAPLYAKIESIVRLDAPAVMIETDDSVEEVVTGDDSFEEELLHDAPVQRAAHLRLRTLG